ncbi:unnamed protein product [marine sediment metagenome]|uniref:Uncharacterized protein n=1 Tax=marine sediment metagenome TaxID=412755 RepID=X1DDF8_9ZZZZ
MNMELDVERDWLDELEKFISRWESETESIKQRTLDPEECGKITDIFHRDSDGLLVRRPVGISDEEIFSRLERLDGKLGSALAMVCISSELKTTKKF